MILRGLYAVGYEIRRGWDSPVEESESASQRKEWGGFFLGNQPSIIPSRLA